MAEFTEETRNLIWTAVHTAPATDIRIFFQPPDPSIPAVSGIDALLTSPAILAEFFRRRAMAQRETPNPNGIGPAREAYIKSLTPGELADIVWRQLFIDHPPVSEAARIVLTTLGLYGIDVASGDLRVLREQFDRLPAAERLARALQLANLDLILYHADCMDAVDGDGTLIRTPPFRPVLSLNRLLGDWKESARLLRQQGFGIKAKVDEFTPIEIRRYLTAEIARVNPVAVSLDWPQGHHPDDGGIGRLVKEGVLPLCRERNLAFFVAAGEAEPDTSPDGVSIAGLAPLWRDNTDVRFLLIPMHEAQLFPALLEAERNRNILLCGPDRPLSHPFTLDAFTEKKLEALGTACHACHSGAETLEELVGGWAHLRWVVGKTLIKHYADLWRTGWQYGEADVRKDVAALMGGNIKTFLGV